MPRAKANWVRPYSRLHSTYGITKMDLDQCCERLTIETGERFELSNGFPEGGFRVVNAYDGYREIRFCWVGKNWNAYGSNFRLKAQGGRNTPSVPWTHNHVKWLYAIIAEELACPYSLGHYRHPHFCFGCDGVSAPRDPRYGDYRTIVKWQRKRRALHQWRKVRAYVKLRAIAFYILGKTQERICALNCKGFNSDLADFIRTKSEHYIPYSF